MSDETYVLILVHFPILYWLIWDQFKTVNKWADIFEEYILPKWFRWENRGDWVSWVQHDLIALLVSLYAGSLSYFTPDTFAFGAMIGGWVAFTWYVIREGINANDNGRVSPDNIMDCVGPLLVALWWTL